VVAISTLDLRDDALEAGASAFLHKPVDPLALVSAVKDVLGRSVYLRTSARRR
jgi:DNA-binding NarL/FixJ family response regulator